MSNDEHEEQYSYLIDLEEIRDEDRSLVQYSYRMNKEIIRLIRLYLADHRDQAKSIKAVLDDAVEEWMIKRDAYFRAVSSNQR